MGCSAVRGLTWLQARCHSLRAQRSWATGERSWAMQGLLGKRSASRLIQSVAGRISALVAV